ncbi:helix-turn-helix domain-containing protein [Leucobacter manosquensis]
MASRLPANRIAGGWHPSHGGFMWSLQHPSFEGTYPLMPHISRILQQHIDTFWSGIARGLSTEDAAVQAHCSRGWGEGMFRNAGGMTPPPRPALSGRYLSKLEREQIPIGIPQGDSIRHIARTLGRSPSTVLREQRRDRGMLPMYRQRHITRPPGSAARIGDRL